MDEPFRADHLATLMSASPDVIFESDPCHMTVRCASRVLRQLAWCDAENKEGREDSEPLLSTIIRAPYWFIITTAGMFLCLPSPLLCDSLYQCITHTHTPPPSPDWVTPLWFRLPPPTVCSQHVSGKAARYPQRMWKVRHSAVSCSRVCRWSGRGLSVFPCRNGVFFFLFLPQGDKNVRSGGRVFMLNLWLRVK